MGSRTKCFSAGPAARTRGTSALETGKILSISRSGDMAVLFGPQNIHANIRRAHARPGPDGGRCPSRPARWRRGRRLDSRHRHSCRDSRPRRWPSVDGGVPGRQHRSMRLAPRGRFGCRRMGAGSRSSRAPDCLRPNRRRSVTVVERSGRKSTLSRNWSGIGSGLGTRGQRGVVYGDAPAMTLLRCGRSHSREQQRTRAAARRTGSSCMTSSADGRVLLSRNTIRVSIACQLPGEASERDLGWAWGATVSDLSPDGQTLIFQEQLGNDLSSTEPDRVSPRHGRISGRSPWRGAYAVALSPDGKWVLARC